MLLTKRHINIIFILLALFSSIEVFSQNLSVSPPITKNDSVLIGKNQTVLIDILSNDTDPDNNIDSNSITITNAPQLGIFQVINKKLSYTPSTNVCGEDSIKYRIKDSNNELSNISVIYITITCFNLAPVATNDVFSIDEDQLDSIDVFDNDLYMDGPGIEMKISLSPKHGTANISKNGILTYQANANYFGNDTLSYIFCDEDPSDELCDTAFVFIVVNPINDTPIAINDTIEVFQGISFTSDLSVNDDFSDGPSSIYHIIQNAKNGTTILNNNGSLTYTSNTSFVGNDTLTYELCDSSNNNLCDTAIVYLIVKEVFDLPIAVNDTIVLKKNDNVNFNILKNDISTYGIVIDSVFLANINPNATITYNDSILNIIPNNDYIGTIEINYFIKDINDSSSNIATIRIIINEQIQIPDQCPVVNLSGQSTIINIFESAIAGNVGIDYFFILINQAPRNGVLSNYDYVNRSITYTSNSNYTGLDSFTYVVRDIDGLFSNSIKICLDVNADIIVKPNGMVSPNGDGFNDAFIIDDIDNYPDNEVIIFDRNWNEVYKTNQYSSTNFWSGTNLQTGTYFYIINIKLNGVEKKIKGYITLIR